jgi:hypothetical protein
MDLPNAIVVLEELEELEVSEPTTSERFGVPPTLRLPVVTGGSFIVGLALGTTQGAQMAGLRFRAENAHRLPTTSMGWYLYHKSKNYHMMLQGIKMGVKTGAKIGFWTGSLFATEELIDFARDGRRDFLSSVIASMSVAGAFSLWNRFSIITAARISKLALIGGLGYGLAQDGISLLKGRRLSYVDFLTGRTRREKRAKMEAL